MRKYSGLVLGDILTLLAVTLVGFLNHGEMSVTYLPRMAATYLPLCLAWFLISPWFQLYQDEVVNNPRLLWQPAVALLFAGPLAVSVRGLILNESIIPIFVVVLSVTSAAGVTLWRAIYIAIDRLKK